MSTKPSTGRVRSAYEFIKAHRDRYSVQTMCRVLGVAPSGYYEWLQQPISNRGQEDARLLRLIRASFVASHGIYGAPRVFLDLREAGETCSKHRVARLMREANLRALHGYRTRRWAVGKPSVLIPNLLQRQFTATRPNTAWVTRHHLHSDVAGLALPGRRHGSVLAHDRGVGRWAHDSPRARAQCRADGGAATTTARHVDSLRSGNPVRQRRVAAILPLESPRAEYEPERQLLGQCRRRVVLQQPEERADQETDLQEPRAGDSRRGRLHRYLLQSNAPPQPSRRAQSRAIRSGSQAAPTSVSTKSWELHTQIYFVVGTG